MGPRVRGLLEVEGPEVLEVWRVRRPRWVEGPRCDDIAIGINRGNDER